MNTALTPQAGAATLGSDVPPLGTVAAWMSSPVHSITPDTPVLTAHRMMVDLAIHRLPVVGAGVLVGMLSMSDVREVHPHLITSLSMGGPNHALAGLRAEQLMTPQPLTLQPETSIAEAARIMLAYKVRGLPVLDKAGRLVGIITESDLFRMLSSTS